jgi:ribosomal peptide maturation radical SAM protein 1
MSGGVVLVSLPWLWPYMPSAPVGLLTAILRRAGIATRPLSLHLLVAELAAAGDDSGGAGGPAASLQRIAFAWEQPETAQAVFAVPPLRPAPRGDADDPLAAVPTDSEVTPERLALLRRLRGLAPRLLHACADEVEALAPQVVGFSVTFTFAQLAASLALARVLKEDDPQRRIVFGGNLAGPVGAALARAFPWVDVVARGRADTTIVPLMEDLLADRPVRSLPGLCVRRGDRVEVTPGDLPTVVALDDLPVPDYDEYFERLERSPYREAIRPLVRIPYEATRGCWWGARSRCRFCGLNATDVAYHAKSPARVHDEILALARRHRHLRLSASDNVLDLRLFETVLPRLAAAPVDLELTFEVKANLRKEQVRLLAAAGVRDMQPGIESLSTPILRLMRKGTSGLHNIRLLKWCVELAIIPHWNLLYGFPREPVEEYARMADVIPSLTHLYPPATGPMVVSRYSDYFEHAAAFGLEILGVSELQRRLYPVDEATLSELAYAFTSRHLDGRDPEQYAAPVRAAALEWSRRARQDYGALRATRGPGFLTLEDRRRGRAAVYTFGETEALIYLACDAGARPASVAHRLERTVRAAPAEDDVRAFLDELVAERLVYREEDRYLSLALSAAPTPPWLTARLEGLRPRPRTEVSP